MQTSHYLSFGCHNLTGGSSKRKSIRLIHCALDHGITRFDVAPSYGLGTAEAVLGIAIKKRGSEVEITTKFGIEPPRFGSILAWCRAPYRGLRKFLGKGPSQLFGSSVNGALPRLRLAKSLERSLRALDVEHLDTLLSHEFVDTAFRTEILHDLEIARNRGLIERFGCSGQRRAVDQTLSMFSGLAQVVQVSVNDGDRFIGFPTLRLFGAVRVLAPQMARQAKCDERYRESLLAALPSVKTFQERVALGAIAATRVLFPQSVLLVTASNEAHIRNIVRLSIDRNLIEWTSAHRAVHKKMLAQSA